jgi:hypothetical protein
MCFSVLWSDEKRVRTYALPDYPLYKKDKTNDRDLARDLFRVLNDADIVVAHNAPFDIKKIKARLVVHDYHPPAPPKIIDTLKIARTLGFDSNKLDNLGRYLNCGRKVGNMGADVWRRCINDADPIAWTWMKKYNAQDVQLLFDVFQKLKAWGNLPDLRAYGHDGCPTCLSHNVQRRGVSVARTRRYQRFQCMNCGSWFSGKQEKHHAQETIPTKADKVRKTLT